MTKCAVFGEKKQPKKVQTPIKFVKYFSALTGELSKACSNPCEFNNILLLRRGSTFDLMFAYDRESTTSGVVYLGKWNDGVA